MSTEAQGYEADRAECLVFTYKDGLLSAVAHDLQIRVSRLHITVTQQGDDLAIDGRFEADSLRVICAMRDGTPQPQQLGQSDRGKIEATIRDEVLRAGRFPEVRYQGTARPAVEGAYQVSGTLTLCGVSRPLELRSQVVAGRHVVETVLHQPDFGIKPFTAMLGTLKIRPDVRVRLSLPA